MMFCEVQGNAREVETTRTHTHLIAHTGVSESDISAHLENEADIQSPR